jgi:hypothetical protein
MTVVLLVALFSPGTPVYTGPPPGHEFWAELLVNAGESPLKDRCTDSPALRIVRAPEALVFSTVVTVVPTTGGAEVVLTRSRDRRREGAESRRLPVSPEQWQHIRRLADAGLWQQRAVAPSGAAPSSFDGVLWLAEGCRDGDYWVIVRHEPRDAAFVEFVAEVMRLAGLAEEVPR